MIFPPPESTSIQANNQLSTLTVKALICLIQTKEYNWSISKKMCFLIIAFQTTLGM